MTTDPANEAREDVQRHWDQAIDVGPETIVSNPQADLCAALKASVDRARRDLAGRQKTETPAATHPAAPSAPQNASGVSEDAGTVESARERAARLMDNRTEPFCDECSAPGSVTDTLLCGRCDAQALADAGLLADPDEMRRLREDLDRARQERDAAESNSSRRLRLWTDATRERDAAHAENARLTGALRELRESTKRSATQRHIIDRALSGEEQR